MNATPQYRFVRTPHARINAAFWIVLGIISLAAFVVTLKDVIESPGTDLRCRVVGARAMMMGLDPYLMPADPHQLQALQDPDRFAADFTRCMYAPTLLCPYVPLAQLPYRAQRFIWFGFEWLAMAASILLLRSMLPEGPAKSIFSAVAILFFADSVFWRLHLERGQYYVFLVFLYSLTARFCIGKYAIKSGLTELRWWHGIPLGVAVALRPTFLAALPPLWMAGLRRPVAGAVIAFALCVAGTLPIAGVGLWRSYFQSVAMESRMLIDADYSRSEHARMPHLSATAEGLTFQHSADLPNVNLNFTSDVLKLMSERFAWMPGRNSWQMLSRIGAAAFCLLFSLACYRSELSLAEKLAAAFLCVLSVDFFLPTRISYADVMFIVPLGLLMPSMLRRREGKLALAFTLAALAVCSGIVPLQIPISVYRPPLLMLGLIGYLVARRWGRSPLSHHVCDVFQSPIHLKGGEISTRIGSEPSPSNSVMRAI